MRRANKKRPETDAPRAAFAARGVLLACLGGQGAPSLRARAAIFRLFFGAELDGEGGADAFLALDGELPARAAAQLFDGGEPQPEPAAPAVVRLVDGVKAVEDAALVFLRDANARIGHGEHGRSAAR